MAESTDNVVLETSVAENASEDKTTTPDTADGEKVEGKMSSKSSDISIEEIGAEEASAPEKSIEDIGPEEAAPEKSEKAEVLIPEIEEIEREPPTEVVAREPARLESVSDEEDDDEDDFEDETLIERLVGLTEMFPSGLTSAVTATGHGAVSTVKWMYSASRSLSWVVCSSAALMFLPIMIETERLGIEEAQKQQQRQMLLGPGAAMSGGAGKAQQNAPLPSVA